jgi:hypothetical protein
MKETTNQAPNPASITGRRRRVTGAHPYPALPKSRLPLLRGVLWVTWAGVLALFDSLRELLPGGRRARRRAVDARATQVANNRPPRVPSLTPTG